MWKQFWFESNLFFDFVSSPDDWKRLREAYPSKSDDDFLNAQEATYNGSRDQAARDKKPNYGFRFEHDGEKTLRHFFAENNMLDLIPAR